MNFNLEKRGAYKYIAFIVVSFALGFYANVVIGNFLDDHPKVNPCDIYRSYQVKKHRNNFSRHGGDSIYRLMDICYDNFDISKREFCIYELIYGFKYKKCLGYGKVLGKLSRMSRESVDKNAKEFVDSLRIVIAKQGALTVDSFLCNTLWSMKYDEHLDMNDLVIDSLINSVHK